MVAAIVLLTSFAILRVAGFLGVTPLDYQIAPPRSPMRGERPSDTSQDANDTASSPGTSGGTIHYSITVPNNGPTAAENVSVSDVIPANTTFVSMIQTGAPTFACTTPASGGSGTATCTVATLNSGASATFTLVVRVAAEAASGAVITNIATVSSSTTDPNGANNTAAVSTTVHRGSAFSVPAISPFAYLILFVLLTLVAFRALRSRTQV